MLRPTLLLFLLVGCPKRDLDRSDPVPGILARADAAWDERGEEGFGPVEEALLEAWNIAPREPEVLWRLVRLKIGQGLAEPETVAARYAYAEGRALGIQCLDGAPAFEQQRTEVSWEAAMERIGPERQPCAAWTALAWARWLEVHGGAAGALDLDALDQLVDAVEGDGPEGVAAWAEGIVLATRPDWAGRDLEAAKRQLEAAVQASPSLTRRIDLFLLAQAPTLGEERDTARQQLASRAPRTPEDRGSLKRLERAW